MASLESFISSLQRRLGGSPAYRAATRMAERALDLGMRARGLRIPSGWFSTRIKADILFDQWEADTREALATRVRPGMVALDVGANIGLYTRFLSRLVGPAGRVIAVEPDPESLRCLRHNTRHLRNVAIADVAAADRAGSLPFYRSGVSGTLNSLVDARAASETLQVRAVALDEYLAAAGIATVDVAKIDVEGAEDLVLRGMERTLRNNPQLLLVLEFCPDNMDDAASHAWPPMRRLPDYQFHAITPGGLVHVSSADEMIPLLNIHGFLNCLASRGRCAPRTP